MLEEQEAAVVDPRHARTEPAGEALGLVLDLHRVGHLLPLHPERRVGEQIVEALGGVLVALVGVVGAVRLERVALLDVGGALALQHHVGAADGVRLVVQLLAEHGEGGLLVVLADVLLRHAQHAAGATRRVVERGLRARLGEDVVVLDEQQVHHQPDHLTRREVLTRRLVRQLGEAPDQFLVEVAHLQVGDSVGVQVDLGELAEHEIEEPRLVEPIDLDGEVEPLEDLAGLR